MFRYITEEQQNLFAKRKAEAAFEKQNNIEAVTNIAFVKLAESGTIDDVTATEHVEVFSEWKPDIAYEANNLRVENGILYRCLQSHTSQTGWEPSNTPSLWKEAGNPAEEYPQWSQPIGAVDAYNTGDKVSDEGKHWHSTVDGNVWKPGIYGWEED